MTDSYTRTAIGLHWIVAALVITALTMGWIMTDLPISPERVKVFDWHKWIGITILALFFVRLAWRLGHPAPPLLPMPAWQHRLAVLSHALLYAMLLVQPLTGWLYSSAAGHPVVYLGLIPLPDMVGRDKALAHTLREIHENGAVVLATLIGVHLLGALKHQLIDHDATLQRMLRSRVR